MRSKIVLVFIFSFYTLYLSGQNRENTELNILFENYEFLNRNSVVDFLDLFNKNKIHLDKEDKITFARKGADAAATFNNDSLYIHFRIIWFFV